ncbi:hypothetical protein SAMN06298216_2680 [Spirosomataceae bacterium TFI 002]|nr:hypothetical protein SAMN06298216_2680 [Spirosomataceae bacterium TFI 002]
MRKVSTNQAILFFLVALTILLLNDFYFKTTFHNAFTGKLSDFAGLLIFPWFWSLFFPKMAKPIYFATALFFVFWKLDASTSIINLLNETIGASFYRVLDLSDIFALTILPVSFLLFQKSKEGISQLKVGLKVGVSSLALFSFFATSQPRIVVEPNWEFSESYVLPYSKEFIFKQRMNARLGATNVDSLISVQDKFRFNYNGGKYLLTFNGAVLPIDSSRSIFRLENLINYTIIGVSNEKKDALNKEELLEIFESEAIDNLKNQESPSFWYFTEIQD